MAAAAQGHARTALFARYSLLGALCAALGALAVAVPDWLVRHTELARLDALRGMFVVYAAIGLVVLWLYRELPCGDANGATSEPVPPRRWCLHAGWWCDWRRSSALTPSPAACRSMR